MTFREWQVATDGYINGLYWPDAWESYGKPGGPFVCYDSKTYPDPSWSKFCKQTARENEIWRQFWAKGYADKLAQKQKVSIDEHQEMCDKVRYEPLKFHKA